MTINPDLFTLVLVCATLVWIIIGSFFTVIYHTVWWLRLIALAVATVGVAALIALLAGV